MTRKAQSAHAEITIQEPNGTQTFRIFIEKEKTGSYFGSLIDEDDIVVLTRHADTRSKVFDQLAAAVWDCTSHNDSPPFDTYKLSPISYINTTLG